MPLQNLTGCAAAFVSFLFKRIHDPNRPAITRTACAAYLASFLARGKFLPKSLLIKSLLDMAKWCADYCKAQDRRQAMHSQPASTAFDMGIQHQVSVLHQLKLLRKQYSMSYEMHCIEGLLRHYACDATQRRYCTTSCEMRLGACTPT